MNLLKHFKTLTLNPKNAKELKGLILQLAIQGKLTVQWRKENADVLTASVLLEMIAKEKEQLIKEKKAKKEKLNPVEDDEFYFHIPSSWKWERLGNVGFIFNGNSVNKNIKEAKYANIKEGFPYIGTKDVGYIFDAIDDDNGVKIPFDEPKFKIAKKDTVLICSEGGNAGKKMGIVNQDCCFGNKLYAFEQHGNLESIYILSLYGSASFRAAFKENMTGIIGGISRNTFASLLIPIPPLEEQKAIVEVVQTLFNEVEQLEQLTQARVQLKTDFVTSAMQQLIKAVKNDTNTQWALLKDHFSTFFTEKENIKKLRESILQLAVQGKLTRHWRESNPDIEDASVLLERIKAEKAQLIAAKKIKKEKPLPAVRDEEVPYGLPEGWKWCRLGEITTIKGGKRLPKGHKLTLEDTGRIYIRVTDMKKGSIDDTNLHYISEEVYEVISKYIIEKEDLYLTIVGATIGKLGLVPDKFHRMNLTENAARIIKYEVDKELLYYFMDSSFVQSQFIDKTNQVGVPKLALHRVSKTLIPLPPKAEQKAIVSKVNALLALCDILEKEIQVQQNTQEQWMQSCLREVFEK